MLEKGRTMVEMVAVLAIIGVLSVGGLLGWRYAMAKIEANRIMDDVLMMAANAPRFKDVSKIPLMYEPSADKQYTVSREGYNIVISVEPVNQKVCELLIDDPSGSVSSVVVGSGGTTCSSGFQQLTFTIALGDGRRFE